MRVYHPFDALEETHAGLWRITSGAERKRHITSSARLMASPERFKAAMSEAVERWPRSCEHNLSAENVNRIAWLGHAGCCVGVGSPEEATRAAWHTLNADQQNEANRVAGEVLQAWIDANAETAPLLDWIAAHAS